MLTNSCRRSGLSQSARAPGGNLVKASSVGANTVNGPGPLSVETRSPAVKAVTNVLNRPSLTAVWTISASCAIEIQKIFGVNCYVMSR